MSLLSLDLSVTGDMRTTSPKKGRGEEGNKKGKEEKKKVAAVISEGK